MNPAGNPPDDKTPSNDADGIGDMEIEEVQAVESPVQIEVTLSDNTTVPATYSPPSESNEPYDWMKYIELIDDSDPRSNNGTKNCICMAKLANGSVCGKPPKLQWKAKKGGGRLFKKAKAEQHWQGVVHSHSEIGELASAHKVA
jgi:hypothetical protein